MPFASPNSTRTPNAVSCFSSSANMAGNWGYAKEYRYNDGRRTEAVPRSDGTAAHEGYGRAKHQPHERVGRATEHANPRRRDRVGRASRRAHPRYRDDIADGIPQMGVAYRHTRSRPLFHAPRRGRRLGIFSGAPEEARKPAYRDVDSALSPVIASTIAAPSVSAPNTTCAAVVQTDPNMIVQG